MQTGKKVWEMKTFSVNNCFKNLKENVLNIVKRSVHNDKLVHVYYFICLNISIETN